MKNNFKKHELVFATSNKHKLEEVNIILSETSFIAVAMDFYGILEDIPETGYTMKENAWIKADYLKAKLNMDCFAEDSGLEIEALGMEPGVYTARYAGDHKSNEDNMQKVLDNLKGETNRKAQYRAVIAMHLKGKMYTFEGIVKGEIATEKKGEGGFGYDPIFIPVGYDYTFGELDADVKKTVSHRAGAIREMVDIIKMVY